MMKLYLDKKGQKLSVFIILGILLLLIFGVVNFTQTSVIPEIEVDDPETAQLFVDSCIQATAREALKELRHGSLEDGETKSVGTNEIYVFSENLKKEDFERQISNYINKNLKNCLSKSEELTLSSSTPKTTILIQDERFDVNVKYDVSIVEEGKSQTFPEFSSTLNYKLGLIIKHLDTIFTKGIILQDYNEDDISIIINPSGDDLFILLIDQENTINGKGFYYGFVKV